VKGDRFFFPRRLIMGKRVFLAFAGAVLGGVLLIGPVAAALLHPPALSPDHGLPGTVVHVSGFPDATTCPSIGMYIAPVAGITTFADPRLRRLTGTVTYGLGGGGYSTGPLVRVPLFRFVVPALGPGEYMTYWTCLGAATGWNALFEDAPFRVDPLPPGATLPPTTTLSTAIRPSDDLAPALWLLIGLLSIGVASGALWRAGTDSATL
jgi:hypothetical protein